MLEFFGKRLRRLHEVERDERGFTLIELLIVIIIIGILAAIAIPVFLAQREKAQAAAVKSDTRNAATSEVMYYAETDAFTDVEGAGGLADQGFRQSSGVTTTAEVPAGGGTYCVESVWTSDATNAALQWHMAENSGGVVTGLCP